jgi:hypothetical protein
MADPTTGPFRQLLRNFSPPWVLRYYGERLSQGMIGLLGDLLGEAGVAAVVSPMLAEEDSPPDAVGMVARSRMLDRYGADTTQTHRARTLDAWDAWTGAGTRESILGQLTAFGFENAYILTMGEDVGGGPFLGDGNTALPRRFWILLTLEGAEDTPEPSALSAQVFRLANKFKAGEERVADVTVMSVGRVWDFHLVTGLPHTWDDPGPGIDTWDSSAGVS